MVGEMIIKNIEEHKCATLGIAMKNTIATNSCHIVGSM